MTTASSLITAAYRRGQITALVSAPSTNEQNEALPMLNQVILSAIGNEAGDELSDLNIGGQWDQSAYCANWIPSNARLQCNLSAATTLKLDPMPYEGQRFSIVDVPGNFATYNLTIDGNGRTIELDTTETFNVNGFVGQWMYFADSGDWSRLTSLALSDDLPFPVEFDGFFRDRLATELFPNNGVTTTPEMATSLARIERKLRARYRKPRPVQDIPRHFLNSRRNSYGLTISDFNAGRPWK